MTSKNSGVTNRHVKKAYGIELLQSQHPAVRKLKNNMPAASIHGNKFWGSSYLLMDYFSQHPITSKSKVLELGCGWGLAGIYCAKKFKAEVTGVDADAAVFPYLQLHADHNQVAIKTLQKRFERITTRELSQFDVIIGADICFWDELSDILYNLINRAVRAGVKKIVLADPERAPFFTLSERCIDRHFAELEPWAVDQPRRSTGCLLIIENQ